jgi:hypothetical protein
MARCSVCGETLAAASWTCSVCGTTMQRLETAPTSLWPPLESSVPHGEVLAPGTRLCPGCGKTYSADYADSFCSCGLELFQADQLPAAIVEEAPPEGLAQPSARGGLPRPPAGTPCLVLYGASKQPVHYFALDKEALLIGRLDAVAGHFPDIDVTQWLDASVARKVSRKHALILRLRSTGEFFLRPLAGNTGTQWGADMVEPLKDYPLEPGRRVILGGAVRFKFEIS